VPNALYYIWELNPPGAGTVDGWGTEVTVNWSDGYEGSSTLRVCGMNESGLGPVSTSLLINHYALPSAELAFTNTTICAGDTTFANITLTGISPWQLIVSLGGNEITLNSDKPNMNGIPFNPTADIEVAVVSVTDGSGCEATGYDPIMISVMQLPSTPPKPTGPEYVDLFAGTQSFYQITGSDDASSYEWTLEPAEAGTLTISENGLDCTVDWTGTYTGQANLEARGINECGAGEFSEMLVVNVANTFGTDENSSGVGIAVFPNPSSGNFKIELTAGSPARARVTVFTATGKPAWGPFELDIDSKVVIPVDVQNLSEGMYLLRVETGKGVSNQKIIIKND
jgi:hypothetical protein